MSKPITLEERYYIQKEKGNGIRIPTIAKQLNRNKTTIYRELKRNTGADGYDYREAQKLADTRRKTARKRLVFTAEMRERVDEQIRRDLSPEQVCGRLQLLGKECVSHERLYQHVWQDKKDGGDLYTHLRVKSKRYHKRGNNNDRRGIIRDKVSIEERPDCVNNREEIGHWEADLVVGKGQKGYLVTATERVSNYNVIGYVETKDAESVSKELVRILRPYKEFVLSVTTDNGKEFANHKYVAAVLQASYYFAHPYSSWERGTNENANGLIRQYLPKGELFSDQNYMKRQIVRIETRLNFRPRKKNGYLTPYELFYGINVSCNC